MDRDEIFYEMAFREIETGEIDKATWAKAFALSSDGEHAKKLYIQYRVEKSKNAPEAGTPDERGAVHQNEPDSRTLENDQLNPIEEESVENKDPSWLTLVINIILIVPPARLLGEWSISSNKNYSFDLLEFLTPQLENGLSWLTLLWPFALVYWIVKINKIQGKAEIIPAKYYTYMKSKFHKIGRNIESIWNIKSILYKTLLEIISGIGKSTSNYFMKWYDFSGRSSRSDFWIGIFLGGIIIGSLFSMILYIVTLLVMPTPVDFDVIMITSYLFFIPSLALLVRRLRDSDFFDRVWYQMVFIILIYPLFILNILFMPSGEKKD